MRRAKNNIYVRIKKKTKVQMSSLAKFNEKGNQINKGT